MCMLSFFVKLKSRGNNCRSFSSNVIYTIHQWTTEARNGMPGREKFEFFLVTFSLLYLQTGRDTLLWWLLPVRHIFSTTISHIATASALLHHRPGPGPLQSQPLLLWQGVPLSLRYVEGLARGALARDFHAITGSVFT